jgi:hypothetical protein
LSSRLLLLLLLLLQVTQLGHVKDLADAFQACIGNPNAARQVRRTLYAWQQLAMHKFMLKSIHGLLCWEH